MIISKKLITIPILLTIILIFAGCELPFQKAEKTTEPPKTTTQENKTEALQEEKAKTEEKSVQAPTAETETGTVTKSLPQTERMEVKTAQIELQIKSGEFSAKQDQVISIATRYEGYIASSNAVAMDGKLKRGDITLRIPAKSFEQALVDLKKLGSVQKCNVETEEVSQEYTDLQSRLRNYQAQQDRLIDLMSEANVDQSIVIQDKLAQIQEQIEIIKGRMQYLENRTAYGTIVATLYEPEAVTPTGGWGIIDAFIEAARGFVGMINFLIIALGYLIPLGLFVWLVVWIIRLIWRKLRARKQPS